MVIHNRYDKLQKEALLIIIQQILLLMNDTRKVVGFHATEVILPTFQNKYADGAVMLDDGSLIHIEFQTDDFNEDFLLRCSLYVITLRFLSNRIVESFVLSTGKRENCAKSIKISENLTFSPKLFFYSEFDGTKRLNKIENIINNNEILSTEFHFDLIFLPLMGNINPIEATYKIIDIVNKEELFTQEEQHKLKKVQYLVANIVAKNDEKLFKKFCEEIQMATLLEEYERSLVEPAVNEAIRETTIKVQAETTRKVQAETTRRVQAETTRKVQAEYDRKIREIAKNLKGSLPVSKISEITGLPVEIIEKL